ncbi:hypothetical protein GCM10009837_52420 [Streptomyces durmitorensis]
MAGLIRVSEWWEIGEHLVLESGGRCVWPGSAGRCSPRGYGDARVDTVTPARLLRFREHLNFSTP